MALMGQHSASSRATGRPDKVAALARAMRALLKTPRSARVRDEIDEAKRGCTDEEYEAAWAMVQQEQEPPPGAEAPGKLARFGAFVSRNWRGPFMAGLVAAIGIGLAVYAAAASYDTVSHLAAAKGVALPRLNPIGIDGGLAGVIILDIAATWLYEPIWWLRWAARLFAAGTVAANASAGWPDSVGTGLRVAAPVLFIVIVEAGRTLLLRGKKAEERKRKAAERQRRRAERERRRGDRIPRVRWLLAFKGTWALWKRMKLWQEPSYTKAVAMELERLAAIEKLAAEYGKAWQAKVPADLAWMLTSGVRMTEALARAAQLVSTEKRDRDLEAELRKLRSSVSAQVAAARAESTEELGALRNDLETAKTALETARGETAEALRRAEELTVKLAAVSAQKKRAKTPASARTGSGDNDPTNELRAVMELRANPKLLQPRMSGELARALGLSPATGRRLHTKLVAGGALTEYAQSLIEPSGERSQ